MIQRVQTLFLIGVVLTAILLFFIPFQIATNEVDAIQITVLSINSASVTPSIYFPFLLVLIIIGLSIFTIIKFKNRVLQYKLANVLLLLNSVLLAIFFLMRFYNGTGVVSFYIAAFLPVIGITFSFLAAHFIKKDEQLVRSADRIR